MRSACFVAIAVLFATANANCPSGSQACTHCFEENRAGCDGNVNDASCYDTGSAPGSGSTFCFECQNIDEEAFLSQDITLSNFWIGCGTGGQSDTLENDFRTMTVSNKFVVDTGSTLVLGSSSRIELLDPGTQTQGHIWYSGNIEASGGQINAPATGSGHKFLINGRLAVTGSNYPRFNNFDAGLIVSFSGLIETEHEGGQGIQVFGGPIILENGGTMRLTRTNSGGGTNGNSSPGVTNVVESGWLYMASNRWAGFEDDTVWRVEADGHMILQSSGVWTNSGGVHNYGDCRAQIYDSSIDEKHAAAIFGDHYVQFPGASLRIHPNNGDEWPFMPTAQAEVMDFRGGVIDIRSQEAFIYGGTTSVDNTEIIMPTDSHIEWGTADESTTPITFEDSTLTLTFGGDWPSERFLWHIHPKNGGVELVNDLTINLDMGSFSEENVYFKVLSVRWAGTDLTGAGDLVLSITSDLCWEQRLDKAEVAGEQDGDFEYTFVLWQCGTEEPGPTEGSDLVDLTTGGGAAVVSPFLLWAGIGGCVVLIALAGLAFVLMKSGNSSPPSYHQPGKYGGQGGGGGGGGAYGGGKMDPYGGGTSPYGGPPAQGGLLQKHGPGPDATTQASGMSRGKRNSRGSRGGRSSGGRGSGGKRGSRGGASNGGMSAVSLTSGTGGSKGGRRRSKSPSGVSKGSRGRSPRRNGAAPPY